MQIPASHQTSHSSYNGQGKRATHLPNSLIPRDGGLNELQLATSLSQITNRGDLETASD